MKIEIIKNKYLIIVFFAIFITGVGCDDMFDQRAGSRITPENHFKDSIDVDISMRGSISLLTESMPGFVLMDGLMSDMMDVTDNSDAYMNELNTHNISSSNPYINPKGFYKCIININEVLANIDRVQVTDPTVDNFELYAYKGALIGLRTWVYFTLSKIYGEAAWIDDNVVELPGTGFKFIPKDILLDTLINQLKPYLHVTDEIEEIRIQKYPNTKALVGEMYLEQNRYDSAAYYLKLGMESHGDKSDLYKVNNSYDKENWESLFINSDGSNNSEIISVVPFELTQGQVNPLYNWSFWEYAIKPSKSTMELFMSQEPLKGKDDFRGVGVSVDTAFIGRSTVISKYALGDLLRNNADIIISRAADIHLLLAEALNRTGETELALTLVNHGINSMSRAPKEYRNWKDNIGIRGRAYVKKVAYPDSIKDDANAVMLYVEDLIIQERALELAFEGKRWFDLVRIASRRGDNNYIANKLYNKFEDESTARQVSDIVRNPSNWYLNHPR